MSNAWSASVRHRAAEFSFLSPAHVHLLDYYSELQDESGGLPMRAAVSLSRLKQILSWVVLADYRGRNDLVASVVGSRIDDALNFGLTGKNMFDVYPPHMADAFDRFFGNVCGHPCGGYVDRNVETRSGLVKGFKVLYLPLMGKDGVADKLLGAASIDILKSNRTGFGTPADLGEIQLGEIRYLDIGYGMPAGA